MVGQPCCRQRTSPLPGRPPPSTSCNTGQAWHWSSQISTLKLFVNSINVPHLVWLSFILPCYQHGISHFIQGCPLCFVKILQFFLQQLAQKMIPFVGFLFHLISKLTQRFKNHLSIQIHLWHNSHLSKYLNMFKVVLLLKTELIIIILAALFLSHRRACAH